MKELDYISIGRKIRTRRKELGVTQEYIANCLDINPSHISNIECGRTNPSLTALINIANVLQCSVDYFINGEYTFENRKNNSVELDNEITKTLQYSDKKKKEKILKMIHLIE